MKRIVILLQPKFKDVVRAGLVMSRVQYSMFTDIVKKTVMPKTLAKVMELFEGIDDRNESSDMVVRAVCVFPVLTNNKELRQLTAAKVTSEILTKRLKKSRNMLMIEAGEITKILIL